MSKSWARSSTPSRQDSRDGATGIAPGFIPGDPINKEYFLGRFREYSVEKRYLLLNTVFKDEKAFWIEVLRQARIPYATREIEMLERQIDILKTLYENNDADFREYIGKLNHHVYILSVNPSLASPSDHDNTKKYYIQTRVALRLFYSYRNKYWSKKLRLTRIIGMEPTEEEKSNALTHEEIISRVNSEIDARKYFERILLRELDAQAEAEVNDELRETEEQLQIIEQQREFISPKDKKILDKFIKSPTSQKILMLYIELNILSNRTDWLKIIKEHNIPYTKPNDDILSNVLELQMEEQMLDFAKRHFEDIKKEIIRLLEMLENSQNESVIETLLYLQKSLKESAEDLANLERKVYDLTITQMDKFDELDKSEGYFPNKQPKLGDIAVNAQKSLTNRRAKRLEYERYMSNIERNIFTGSEEVIERIDKSLRQIPPEIVSAIRKKIEVDIKLREKIEKEQLARATAEAAREAAAEEAAAAAPAAAAEAAEASAVQAAAQKTSTWARRAAAAPVFVPRPPEQQYNGPKGQIGQRGRGYTNINYEEKYLKYKSKYMELKLKNN